MMNKFDMQIQCEEFYKAETIQDLLGEQDEVTTLPCFSQVEETMDKIAEYQLLFEDAEMYLANQVDSDDHLEYVTVVEKLITYQQILDDLKSLSWVAEYFVNEPVRRRYYDCNNCPFTEGEKNVNSCTCGCALFTEEGILLHD